MAMGLAANDRRAEPRDRRRIERPRAGHAADPISTK